jgi:hypothetical protein
VKYPWLVILYWSTGICLMLYMAIENFGEAKYGLMIMDIGLAILYSGMLVRPIRQLNVRYALRRR